MRLTSSFPMAGHDKVQKVTLIPRGQAKGLTWFQPGEDPSLISKQQIMARLVGALGGRAAEEVIFGDAEVTTGASGDLQQVPLQFYSAALTDRSRGHFYKGSVIDNDKYTPKLPQETFHQPCTS